MDEMTPAERVLVERAMKESLMIGSPTQKSNSGQARESQPASASTKKRKLAKVKQDDGSSGDEIDSIKRRASSVIKRQGSRTVFDTPVPVKKRFVVLFYPCDKSYCVESTEKIRHDCGLFDEHLHAGRDVTTLYDRKKYKAICVGFARTKDACELIISGDIVERNGLVELRAMANVQNNSRSRSRSIEKKRIKQEVVDDPMDNDIFDQEEQKKEEEVVVPAAGYRDEGMNTIVTAKDKQVAQANQAADALIAQIEAEEEQPRSKKLSKQRPKEKKKAKKQEKKKQEDSDEEDEENIVQQPHKETKEMLKGDQKKEEEVVVSAAPTSAKTVVDSNTKATKQAAAPTPLAAKGKARAAAAAAAALPPPVETTPERETETKDCGQSPPIGAGVLDSESATRRRPKKERREVPKEEAKKEAAAEMKRREERRKARKEEKEKERREAELNRDAMAEVARAHATPQGMLDVATVTPMSIEGGGGEEKGEQPEIHLQPAPLLQQPAAAVPVAVAAVQPCNDAAGPQPDGEIKKEIKEEEPDVDECPFDAMQREIRTFRELARRRGLLPMSNESTSTSGTQTEMGDGLGAAPGCVCMCNCGAREAASFVSRGSASPPSAQSASHSPHMNSSPVHTRRDLESFEAALD